MYSSRALSNHPDLLTSLFSVRQGRAEPLGTLVGIRAVFLSATQLRRRCSCYGEQPLFAASLLCCFPSLSLWFNNSLQAH